MKNEFVIKGDLESNLLIKNENDQWLSINRTPSGYTVNSSVLTDSFDVSEREMKLNPTIREFFRSTQVFSLEKTRKKIFDHAVSANKKGALIKLDKDDLNLSFKTIKKMFINPSLTKDEYLGDVYPNIYNMAKEVSKTLHVEFAENDLQKIMSVLQMPTIAYTYPEKINVLKDLFEEPLEQEIYNKYN